MKTSNIFDLHCPIESRIQLGPSLYKFRLPAPQIAKRARAGHFVQIRLRTDGLPLLRRPFSLYDASAREGWIELLFKVYGQGTSIMAQFREGQTLQIMGPLGQPWRIDPPGEFPPLLLGGGIGVVPLYFLATELEREGRDFQVAIGLRTGSEKGMAADFREFDAPLKVYTQDGSLGEKGLVTRALEEEEIGPLYVCGPSAMLEAVVQLAKARGLSGQMSVEERMPCGFGICYGCVVYSKEKETYVKSCQEGPVFDLDEVILGG